HVMKARTVIGVADIHARPLANRIKALQDLDRFGAIAIWQMLVVVGPPILPEAVTIPASTCKNSASLPSVWKRASSVPVIQTCEPNLVSVANSASRRAASR